MKVWLDDEPIRDPGSDWVIVRTADEAIDLLLTGEVEMISLDHDLGDFHEGFGEVTGFAVVRWMIENKVFPKVINVHSHNPRAKEMAADLERFAPDGCVVKRWRFDVDVVGELVELLKIDKLKGTIGE